MSEEERRGWGAWKWDRKRSGGEDGVAFCEVGCMSWRFVIGDWMNP